MQIISFSLNMHATTMSQAEMDSTRKHTRGSVEKFGNDDYQIVIAFGLSKKT